MFWDLTCPSCRRRRLIGHRAVAVHGGGPGIRVELSCPCGERTIVRTGRRGPPAGPAATTGGAADLQ